MHHIQENLKMKIIFLPSWVATKDSAVPEGGNEISIEKLESQLNTLKTMFAEKQKLVSDLEAYGPEGEQQSVSQSPLFKQINKGNQACCSTTHKEPF